MTITIGKSTSQWLRDRNYEPSNIELRGNNGDTALMQATREGEIAVVRDLLAAGATVNARNNDGNNALWFACFGNYENLIYLLVEAEIDLDNQNDNGATALMYAASAGKAEMVQLLLNLGANASLRNLDDFRAIDFAATIEILGCLKNASRFNDWTGIPSCNKTFLFFCPDRPELCRCLDSTIAF